MKKEQQTDRIIRNKLKYHASASPDHLWSAIEAELPEEKKDRGMFWWLTGGFLGLALVLAVLGIFVFGESTTDNSQLSTKENTSINNTNNKKINNTEAITETIVAQDEVKQTSNYITKTDNDFVATSIAQVIEKPSDNPRNTPAQPRNIREQEVKNQISLVNEVKKSSSDATISIFKGSSLQEETKVSENKLGFDNVNATTASSFVTLKVPSQVMPLLENEEKELDWPSLLKDPKCATFGKWLKLAFYGDFYIAPEVAFRQLNSKGTDFETYAANRESTESQLLSYSAGARFSVVSNYGFSLRSGIVYSQINERFDYAEERSERTIIDENFDSEGNLISSDTIIENGTHFIKTYNRYRMVDIPLLIGYEVSFKKFSLSLNTGIYANLLFRQKGDFLSPDLEPVTFTSDAIGNYPAFRSRLNLSIYGSIAMYYNLNDRWQLMLEPQVRHFLDPLTTSNYMVEQRYTTAGLITGLRYRF